MFRTFCALIAFTILSSVAYGQVHKGNITFNTGKSDPVTFSHDYHVKYRGVKCAACHFRTFAASDGGFQMKKDKLNKREFCGHCHNGLKSFDAKSEKNCSRCHKK